MFTKYTLPYKLISSDNVITLDAGLAICMACVGCRKNEGKMTIPLKEFGKCWIRRPIPKVGTILADYVLYNVPKMPMIALPASIPDETQVSNYIITIIFYLLCLLIILVKLAIRRKRKAEQMTNLQRFLIYLYMVFNNVRNRTPTKANNE